MKKSILMLLFIQIIIQFFLTTNLYSECRPYEGSDFDNISHRLKEEKVKIRGSGYTQNKPDSFSTLTVKLVQKGKKYIKKMGLKTAIDFINNKPRKFREFKTHLFIMNINGNVLAHSGNPNFTGMNMLSTKDSRGHLFVQEYLDNISELDGINYMNLKTLADDTRYIYNYVYLVRIDDDLIIGAVAKP